MVQLGKAAMGDKTMVDTLEAAIHSLRASCTHYEALPDAFKACRRAARLAAEGTIPMIARKGRASDIGERSAARRTPAQRPRRCFSKRFRRPSLLAGPINPTGEPRAQLIRPFMKKYILCL